MRVFLPFTIDYLCEVSETFLRLKTICNYKSLVYLNNNFRGPNHVSKVNNVYSINRSNNGKYWTSRTYLTYDSVNKDQINIKRIQLEELKGNEVRVPSWEPADRGFKSHQGITPIKFYTIHIIKKLQHRWFFHKFLLSEFIC